MCLWFCCLCGFLPKSLKSNAFQSHYNSESHLGLLNMKRFGTLAQFKLVGGVRFSTKGSTCSCITGAVDQLIRRQVEAR